MLFGPADDFMPTADAALRGGAGVTGGTNTGTSAALAASGTARKQHGAGKSTGRKGFEPLLIQSMTHDRLQASLAASKVNIIECFLFLCVFW